MVSTEFWFLFYTMLNLNNFYLLMLSGSHKWENVQMWKDVLYFFFSFLSNMHAFVQICQLFFSVWLILIYYRSMLIISPARPWNTLNNMGERKQSIVGKYLDYLMGAIMMIKLECVFCFFRMINAYWSSIASCWDK